MKRIVLFVLAGLLLLSGCGGKPAEQQLREGNFSGSYVHAVTGAQEEDFDRITFTEDWKCTFVLNTPAGHTVTTGRYDWDGPVLRVYTLGEHTFEFGSDDTLVYRGGNGGPADTTLAVGHVFTRAAGTVEVVGGSAVDAANAQEDWTGIYRVETQRILPDYRDTLELLPDGSCKLRLHLSGERLGERLDGTGTYTMTDNIIEVMSPELGTLTLRTLPESRTGERGLVCDSTAGLPAEAKTAQANAFFQQVDSWADPSENFSGAFVRAGWEKDASLNDMMEFFPDGGCNITTRGGTEQSPAAYGIVEKAYYTRAGNTLTVYPNGVDTTEAEIRIFEISGANLVCVSGGDAAFVLPGDTFVPGAYVYQ